MPTETQKVFFPTIEDFAQFRVDLFRAASNKFRGIHAEIRHERAPEIFRRVLRERFGHLMPALTSQCIAELEADFVKVVKRSMIGTLNGLKACRAEIADDLVFMTTVNWLSTHQKEKNLFLENHRGRLQWAENVPVKYCPKLTVQMFPIITSLVIDGKFTGTVVSIENINTTSSHGVVTIDGPKEKQIA